MTEQNIMDTQNFKTGQVIYGAGDTIEFMLPDKKGKANWFPGKIHGVKTTEDPKTHAILTVSYLVDTGRDERVDESPIDVRGREIEKRVQEVIKKDSKKTILDAVKEVSKHADLPPAGTIEIEKVRQPEQIELSESMIRKA
jgi:hypothetical protein